MHRPKLRCRTLALSSALLLAACVSGDAGRVRTEAVVRDSAGIRIVENSDPVWAEGEAWTIAAEPRVTIGRMDGPEAYQLFRVRSALRLEDGRIAVANAGTNEIRFYDPAGVHQATVGGEGEGPGEFRGLMGVWPWRGDSLVAIDYYVCRLSVFSGQGAYGRTFPLTFLGARPGCPVPRGLMGDGSLVLMPGGGPIPAAQSGGTSRTEQALVRLAADDRGYDTLAVLFTIEWVTLRSSRRVFSFPVPLAGMGLVAVGQAGVYYGNSGAYSVAHYAAGGTLDRMVRRVVEPRPVTDADLAAIWDTAAGLPYLRDEMSQAQRADVPVPQTLPAFAALLVDDLGNLWVQGYAPPGSPTAPWDVFDSAGVWLGTVSVPDRVTLTQVGADFVLGTWQDELDVEYVGLWALEKGRGTGG